MSGRIAYICLSDLHLGDSDSLLTSAAQTSEGRPGPSDVLAQLVTCLGELTAGQDGPLPTLILNGDILELAFGPLNHALGVFESFLEMLTSRDNPVVGRIVYVPGNHDHHIWELARETQYALALAARHSESGPPVARHTTPLSIDAAVPDRLLGALLAHATKGPGADDEQHHGRHDLRVAYPNLALHDAESGRVVLFHHGHFVEQLYRLFSRGSRWLFPQRAKADTVERIEAENFAWIEFVWSLLGRSGEAGEDVENLFEMLRYPQRTRAYTRELARRVAPQIRMPFLPFTWMRRYVLGNVLQRLSVRLEGERLLGADACSESSLRGVKEYLFGPAYRQLETELGDVPENVTFVFGHTHKPFEMQLDDPRGRPVRLLNTGGWTIDTADANATYGAAAVLVSDDLDVVSVNAFRDAPGVATSRAEVHAAPGSRPGALHAAVSATVASSSAWRALSQLIVEESAQKRVRHRERFGSGPRE